jgi:hypothetical protein
MKILSIAVVLTLASVLSVQAQSESFQTLKSKFSGYEDVHAFSISGFFARTALWMAGEHDFNQGIRQIRSIHMITIPKSAFDNEHVTLNGFKKVASKDSYQELLQIRDHGDDVTLLIQHATKNRGSRYLFLVDSENEVVAIEVKGIIDPELIMKNSNLSYQH